eukprot:CAMPEP_0198727336 /NCGR_PEP_ID=MMETSP1475-20131203/4096_1 /TAXON_ID= ORGANISM="Unidentified sp., Strain CCMP1999" /NCGR_SAMPLE_ID=MMETSP1475 /ASSEMBLY_ACC=CAM_ASM_001111 /LENGTH=432 /DNA_ID=CAMNT_0044489363 /DNA_START=183 /DNA_END=1481 /DNA_ORIENTATION=+
MGSVYNSLSPDLQDFLTDEGVDLTVGWGLKGAFTFETTTFPVLDGCGTWTNATPLSTSSSLIVMFSETDSVVRGLVSFLDRQHCFASPEARDNVELRFVADLSPGMPQLYTSSFKEDGMIELVKYTYNSVGERRRLSDTAPATQPWKVRVRQIAEEKRYCGDCVSRGRICECSEYDRQHRLADKFAWFDSLNVGYSGASAWRRLRYFVGGMTGDVGEVRISKYVPARDGAFVNAGSMTIGTHFNHIMSGDNLEGIKLLHAQSLLMRSAPVGLCLISPAIADETEAADATAGQVLKEESAQYARDWCSSCDITFAEPYEYCRHLNNVHLNHKPYQCTQCDRSFSRRAHVAEHISAVHEDRRDRVCSECGAKFRTQSKLTRHHKTVHLRLRPYACKHCAASFCQKSDLVRHENAKHKHLAADLSCSKVNALVHS